MTLTVASMFSGIGLIDLGLERAGMEERRKIRKRRQRGKRKGTAFSAALEAALADEKAARAARRGAA